MHIYIIKRILQTIPVILIVTLITFSLMHLTPGDPAIMRAGEDATQEQVDAIRKSMGLDLPIHQQYFNWMIGLVQGDLGRSLQDGRPVFITLIRRLPATLQLVLVSFIVSVGVGVPIGVLSALKQNTLVDSIARVFSLLGISMPNFWMGLMFMLIFSHRLRLLPASGSGTLLHLIMPGVALGLPAAGLITRLTRSSLLEVLKEDYIRTAEAKGLNKQIVIYKHALKNAILPVVTIIGLQLGYRLGGSVIIESVFAYPGIGRFAYLRLLARDYPMIMGNLLIFAIIFIIINLLTDILYGFLEPRIRYD